MRTPGGADARRLTEKVSVYEYQFKNKYRKWEEFVQLKVIRADV